MRGELRSETQSQAFCLRINLELNLNGSSEHSACLSLLPFKMGLEWIKKNWLTWKISLNSKMLPMAVSLQTSGSAKTQFPGAKMIILASSRTVVLPRV